MANRFLRPYFEPDDDAGSSVAELLSPIAVLAALFIGLVLSDVTSSYSAARESAADEANVVDNLFETTEYLPGSRFPEGGNMPQVITMVIVVVLTGASLLLIRGLDGRLAACCHQTN